MESKEAKPELKVLAQNKLAGDETDFNASPAISDGNLFIRSDRALCSIGKTQKL